MEELAATVKVGKASGTSEKTTKVFVPFGDPMPTGGDK